MSNPFFSIIIPIYKVEKYLRQCIDSVLSQTYKDYEIILVDDGSPDQCPVICDEYKDKYSFIRVIHKQNGGLSSARNAGLLKAAGDYVLFLDSDDYWDNINALKLISEKITAANVDLLMWSSHKRYNQKTGSITELKQINFEMCSVSSNAEFFESMVKRDIFEISACFKAIKRNILIDNQIFFPEGKTTEDILFSINLFEHVESLAIIDCCFYVYRVREGSITNSISKKSIESYLDIIFECLKVVDEGKPELRNALMSYLAYQYLLICANIGNTLKKQEQKQFYPQLKEIADSGVMKYRLHPKVKIMGPIYDIGGYKALILSLGVALKYFYR